MLRRIRRKLGTAGIVVSIVALIAALAGGAYAATGALTAKQKKEVKAIAKSFQGSGPAGLPGAAGANGKEGVKGEHGVDGENGADVDVFEVPIGEPGCEGRGGVEVEVEGSNLPAEVCSGKNGAQGEPWTPSNTLPVNATETGVWAFNGSDADSSGILAPISFTIKLAAALNDEKVHFQTDSNFKDFDGAGGAEIGCKGPNVDKPSAPSGNLCIYFNAGSFGEPVNATLKGIYKNDLDNIGANITGAVLNWAVTAPGVAQGAGTWAVTG